MRRDERASTGSASVILGLRAENELGGVREHLCAKHAHAEKMLMERIKFRTRVNRELHP